MSIWIFSVPTVCTNTAFRMATYYHEITWEAIEQWCRIDDSHRKGCPEAGLLASKHQLAPSIQLGNRTQISRLPPKSHAANPAGRSALLSTMNKWLEFSFALWMFRRKI